MLALINRMGGGILPVAFHKGEVYFLFSREYKYSLDDGGLWSDFGGSRDGKETYKQTAIREGYEESSGILGGKSKITKLINNHVVDIITLNGFREYFVEIKYDPTLPKEFRNNFLEIKKRYPDLINKNGLYEKDMLKWVSYRDLQSFLPKLRPWYKNIILQIL
jgi:hypothetical protein